MVLLLAAGFVTAGAGESRAAAGSLLLSETFSGSTVTDPGFVPLDDACLTGAAGPPPVGQSALGPCTDHQSGPVPPIGVTPGYLQLTDVLGGATGGVLYNRPLPGNGGLEVTFEQYQYGGTAADGISFFLVDGAAELTKTGAYGGGLGYAQRGDDPGVAHGYLGVGLDAYGNFAVDFEGRGAGCPDDEKPPSVYRVYDRPPNNVTLRGPGDGLSGYCYLAGTGTTTPIGTDPDGNILYGSTLPGRLHADTLDTAKRTVRVTVSAAVRPTVTVEIDFGSGFQQVLTRTMPQDAPRTYKFGWAASTGSETDVHLIRNVEVSSVVPLNAVNLVKQIDMSTPQPDVYEIGDVVPYQFVVTNTGTQALTGVSVSDPRVGPVTCPRTTLAPSGEPDATMTCTANYVITAADVGGGTLTNTAVAHASAGGSSITSNESSVTIEVGGGRLHLTKTAERDGDEVHYKVTAENTGDRPLTDARFTDNLSGVLDDAALVGLPVATSGTVAVTGTTLTWEGTLTAGQTATVTYTVRINPSGGDRVLRNSVTSTTRGSNCTSTDACVTVIDLGQGLLHLAKTASKRHVRVGDRITYRVVAVNDGDADLVNATFTDDLSGDLDDATYDGDATATVGTVTFASPLLTWKGTLKPGERAVVTYTLTVKQGGDGRLRNTVTTHVTPSNCPAENPPAQCTVTVFKSQKKKKTKHW
jgi:uncharacterized repeat protein (TIGR01451 family)/fimbrial isopeptide formation D2 family protein